MRSLNILDICRIAWILAKKDLQLEFRRSYEVLSILTFSAGSIFIASLALRGSASATPAIAIAMIWVILFFANILIFTTSFMREADRGTIGGLKTLPYPYSVILTGKIIYGTLAVFFIECFLIPFVTLFFSLNFSGDSLLQFLFVYFLGAIGLSFTGSFTSGLVMFSEGKTLLLSFLLVPTCIPIILPSVVAMEMIVEGAGIIDIIPELRLLFAYLFLIIAIMAVTFTSVLE